VILPALAETGMDVSALESRPTFSCKSEAIFLAVEVVTILLYQVGVREARAGVRWKITSSIIQRVEQARPLQLKEN